MKRIFQIIILGFTILMVSGCSVKMKPELAFKKDNYFYINDNYKIKFDSFKIKKQHTSFGVLQINYNAIIDGHNVYFIRLQTSTYATRQQWHNAMKAKGGSISNLIEKDNIDLFEMTTRTKYGNMHGYNAIIYSNSGIIFIRFEDRILYDKIKESILQ